MSVISTSDFSKDPYRLAINPSQSAELQEYIDNAQKEYLVQLFGVELYDLFIADLVSDVPTTARFIKIFEPFIDQTNDVLTMSDGIKDMLKGFAYYTFLRDHVTRVDTTGISKILGENSQPVSAIYHNITRRYNSSVETFRVIQNYMLVVDPDNYPEFNGVCLEYNQPF